MLFYYIYQQILESNNVNNICDCLFIDVRKTVIFNSKHQFTPRITGNDSMICKWFQMVYS